jgi:hypothetical protein
LIVESLLIVDEGLLIERMLDCAGAPSVSHLSITNHRSPINIDSTIEDQPFNNW